MLFWNENESFPSLGIGHFIWFPKGKEFPFKEVFPDFVAFAKERGVFIPPCALGCCPWNNRKEFIERGEEGKLLHQFLIDTIALQARFMLDRMEERLPKVIQEINPEKRERVRRGVDRLLSSDEGAFILIDYLNFKGDGLSNKERYPIGKKDGEGWGLLQVFEEMDFKRDDLAIEFVRAAKTVLSRRIKNAPSSKAEERWWPGWSNRLGRYLTSN